MTLTRQTDKGKTEEDKAVAEGYTQYEQSRFKLPVHLIMDVAFSETTGRKRKHDSAGLSPGHDTNVTTDRMSQQKRHLMKKR